MHPYPPEHNQKVLECNILSSNYPLYQKQNNSSSISIFNFSTTNNQSKASMHLVQKQQQLNNQEGKQYEGEEASEIPSRQLNFQSKVYNKNNQSEEQSLYNDKEQVTKKVQQKNKNNGSNCFYRQNPFKTNSNPFEKIKNRNTDSTTNPFSSHIFSSQNKNILSSLNSNPFLNANINQSMPLESIRRSSALNKNPFSSSHESHDNFSLMMNRNMRQYNQHLFNPLNSRSHCDWNKKNYHLETRLRFLEVQNKQMKERYQKLQQYMQQLKADKKDKQSLFEFCAAQLVKNTNKTRYLQQKLEDIQNRMQNIVQSLSTYDSKRNEQRCTHENNLKICLNQTPARQSNYLSSCSKGIGDFEVLSIQDRQQVSYRTENHSQTQGKNKQKENGCLNTNLLLKQMMKSIKQNHEQSYKLLTQSKSLSEEQTKLIQKNTKAIEILFLQMQEKKGNQNKYQNVDNKQPNQESPGLAEPDLEATKSLNIFKIEKVQKKVGEYTIKYELSDKGILNNFLKNLIIQNNHGKVIFLEEIPRNNFDNIFYQKSIQKFIVIQEKKCQVPEYEWKLYQKQVIFYNYFELSSIERSQQEIQQKLREYDLDFHPRKKRYDIKTNCLHLW